MIPKTQVELCGCPQEGCLQSTDIPSSRKTERKLTPSSRAQARLGLCHHLRHTMFIIGSVFFSCSFWSTGDRLRIGSEWCVPRHLCGGCGRYVGFLYSSIVQTSPQTACSCVSIGWTIYIQTPQTSSVLYSSEWGSPVSLTKVKDFAPLRTGVGMCWV